VVRSLSAQNGLQYCRTWVLRQYKMPNKAAVDKWSTLRTILSSCYITLIRILIGPTTYKLEYKSASQGGLEKQLGFAVECTLLLLGFVLLLQCLLLAFGSLSMHSSLAQDSLSQDGCNYSFKGLGPISQTKMSLALCSWDYPALLKIFLANVHCFLYDIE
jgi:hypothetical protein